MCHQSMFCKKDLFQKKLFDLEYKVCADREWQMYHIKNGAIVKAMKFPVAEVLTDGFSKNHVEDLENESGQCIRNYCGKWYIIYKIITHIFMIFSRQFGQFGIIFNIIQILIHSQ